MSDAKPGGRGGAQRIALWTAAFVVLAGAGAAWAISRSGLGVAELAPMWSLSPLTIATIAVLALGLYAADILRYKAFGRAVGEELSLRTALDAVVANFFFSWLTPGSAMGAPATIYVLGRRGISWHCATLIAVGKSLSGIAVVLVIAAVLVALGLGPHLSVAFVVVAVPGLVIVFALVGLLGAAGIWPVGAKRAISGMGGWLARRRLLSGPRASAFLTAAKDGAAGAVDRLEEVFGRGVAHGLFLFATHFIYYGCIALLGGVIALAFGAESLLYGTSISLVFVAFSYIAPTPGGAGLTEAMAVTFYGSILPPAEAVVVVLLYRCVTFYFHIVVGLPYLLIALGSRGLRSLAAKENP